MATDLLTPAILGYIDHGAYPESEDIASAHVPTESLEALLEALQRAQNGAKDDVRSLSRSSASDIDTWISRAKELQKDILRSRDTARNIVSAAEEASKLKSDVQDSGSRAALLAKEVAFNESLAGTLEHLKSANGMLDAVLDATSTGRVAKALNKLEDADSTIAGLESLGNSRAFGVLKSRSAELRTSIAETANDYWKLLVTVDPKEHHVLVRDHEDDVVGGDIHTVLDALEGLNTLDSTLQTFGRDFDRIILKPRVVGDRHGRLGTIRIDHDCIVCRIAEQSSRNPEDLFRDLKSVVEYLSTRLPPTVCVPLSKYLIPNLASQLEEEWLEPALPLELSQMSSFNGLLENVTALANQIDELEWDGSVPLREWVQHVPRAWLTKRREAVLGDVRNLVFAGLRDTKMVERVETQMVSKEDALAGGSGEAGGDAADDEWDAWDDTQEEDPVPPTPQTKSVYSDGTTDHSDIDADDEASAWGIDDNEDETPHAGEDKDEDEAWGWGNDDESQKPPSPMTARKQPPSPLKNLSQPPASHANEREMTLRESYTITSIPDSILDTVQRIIADAQSLASHEHASSPIASAATALYTLPTLALAIYRATAPTAYSNLPVGNMLIYNDSLRLASSLRNWQNSQPPQSRLRLDADVKALETFAKRAYTSEMESQRTIIRDMLDGAQGFGNCTVQPYKNESESAVDQTVHRLREVHKQWKDVLPPSALLQSLGNLLATVTGKMITEIEDLQDISEADSKQLKMLLETVSELKRMFITPAQPRPAGGTGGEGNDMTFIYCPNWLKFQYLGEVLESSLADIKYMWQEGELSLEFEAEEVVELIEALFAESDYRRKAVGDIRRGR